MTMIDDPEHSGQKNDQQHGDLPSGSGDTRDYVPSSEQHTAENQPTNDLLIPETFCQLAVPVPPMLEAVIGHEGDARFVAFYWGGGDEVYYDDGRLSGTGEWSPYLCFVRHRAVWPALVGYDFGSSDAPAQHYLVLDRQTRTCMRRRSERHAVFWDGSGPGDRRMGRNRRR